MNATPRSACPSRPSRHSPRVASGSRLRTLTAAVLFALGAANLAPALAAVDNPPTTPASLTADRHSNTAGEIRWARSSDDRGAVRGYEVTRDGVSLGIRDALSVYENALSTDKRYAYTVAAVDSAGQRSPLARVVLDTRGSSTGSAAPAPNAPAAPSSSPSPFAPLPPAPSASAPSPGAPSAPAGLTAKVYSKTAGEIVWTRSSTPGLRYEISRDGALVKTTDGVSHYDDALSGSTRYRYDVVAVDRAGNRSVPASVTLTTRGDAGPIAGTPPPPTSPPAPAPAAAPTITAGNAEALLLEAFDRMAGNGYGEQALDGFSATLAAAGFALDAYRAYNTTVTGTIDCQYAGKLDYALGDYGSTDVDKLSFDECESHELYASGKLERSSTISRGDDISTTGTTFSIDRPRAYTYFDGSVSTSADSIGKREFGLSGHIEVPTSDRGLLTLREAKVYRECGVGDVRGADLDGSRNVYLGQVHRARAEFRINSPGTYGHVLTVKTPNDFRHQYVEGVSAYRDGPWTFERGRMTITAEDGSRLEMRAGNGDPKTYRLRVTGAGKRVDAVKPIEPLMKRFSKASYCG